MNTGGNDFGVFQTTIMLEEQRKLIARLEETRTQLFQSEKLASIGQLAAGVAHEINNPIGIVKAHNGTIDVDSRVGEGTTFTVRLPVHRKNG